MTEDALAAPPKNPMSDGKSDLSESMERNLEADLQRLMRVRGYPQDKREFQRAIARSVSRYMDTVRAWVRETGARLIADEEKKFNEATAPQREAHEAARVRAKAEYDAAILSADNAFLESVRSQREALESAIRSLRGDMARRMAEADRIERSCIRGFKEEIAERFREGVEKSEKGRRNKT